METLFPLARAGGAFLLASGLFFALTRLDETRWRLWLAAAFIAGMGAATWALTLQPSLGRPSGLHWAALGLGFALEIAGIIWANRRFAHDERKADLAVLIVVALHFLPMAYAIGPLMAVLAAAGAWNAWRAWDRPDLSLRQVGLIDAGLKMATGIALIAAYPPAL